MGVSKKTILRRLSENNIQRRKQPTYEAVTEEVLRDLYTHQKLSTRTIASKFGCSSRFIINRLGEYGIQTRKHAGDSAFSEEERKEKWGKPLEKHNLWKGGITPLNESLRNATNDWKFKVFRDSGFTCYITGNKTHDLHAHHITPFRQVRDECIAELNLDKKGFVRDYTEGEITSLKCLIKERHKEVEGYSIASGIHLLFHSIYGDDTTINDLEKFKVRYLSGEFNKEETA